MSKYKLSIALILLVNIQLLFAQNNPIELGAVHWLRDYDQAIKESKQKDLPIFMLFQEVPGCATCQNFGQDVMSDPILVEAIETFFVPLAIFNNKSGKDAAVLKKYNEPSWNNPVIRIINEEGENLTKRQAGIYTQKAILGTIMEALALCNIVPPKYLIHYDKYLSLKDSELNEAYLSMYCFWTGEKEIAQIPGVISTEAGYMNGKEVVKVAYSEDLTDLEDIVSKAKAKSCADDVYKSASNSKYKKDRESKYYLIHSKYSKIEMNEYQAMKVNSALGRGEIPDEYLSPRQLTQLGK